MKTILGGYIIDGGNQRQQLSVISNPNDSDIERALSSIDGASGVIGLRCQPEPEVGPYELTIYSERGNFLIMLNEYEDDGDTNVRTINKANSDNEQRVSILGDLYPVGSTTRDYQLIYSISKEFNDTGNVSEELMN